MADAGDCIAGMRVHARQCRERGSGPVPARGSELTMQRRLRTRQGPSIAPAVDAPMFAVVGETIPEWAGAEISEIILYTYKALSICHNRSERT